MTPTRPLRVGFQGVHGAYSEAAVLQLERVLQEQQQQQVTLQPIPMDSFEDAARAVSSGSLDRALIPIQNSLGGTLSSNYDLLLRYKLFIHSELQFRVRHSLLVLPGTSREEITSVLSHPQALAQCDEYIRAMPNPLVKPCPFYDTAGAAKRVLEEGDRSKAAIASPLACSLYSLEELDSCIEDHPDNYTRFLLLASHPSPPPPLSTSTSNTTTSLMFVLPKDLPGALFKALSIFALRDIQLTKIESRPVKGLSLLDMEYTTPTPIDTFSHLFYVDVVAHPLRYKPKECSQASLRVVSHTPSTG